MTDIKQFKLTNNDEIICQVLQYDDADNAAMVVRGTMRIIAAEDYTRGVRFYAFRPWMGFTDGPDELNLDSDKGSNIIKFRPKGTMH